MAALDEKTGSISAPQIKRFGEVARGYTAFEEGDVLFAKVTPCMENGKVAVATSLMNGVGFGSTEFHVLRPCEELLSEYLFYYFRQSWFRKQAAQSFVGTGGLQRVPPDFFDRAKMVVPPLDEQREIVSFLEQVKSISNDLSARDEKVRQVMDRLLDSIVSSQPDSVWEEIGAFLETRYGTSTRGDADSRTGRPVLRIPNVLGGEVELGDLKHAALSTDEIRRLALLEGDVLVVRSNGNPGYVGRSAAITQAVAQGEFVFASYLIRLRPTSTRIVGSFLAALLNSPHGRQAMQHLIRTTAGQSNISAESLSRLRLPIPPLKVQMEFDSAWKEYVELRKLCRHSEETQQSLFEELTGAALAGTHRRPPKAQHLSPSGSSSAAPAEVASVDRQGAELLPIPREPQERDTAFARPRREGLLAQLSFLQEKIWNSIRHEWRGAVVVGDPKAFSEFCDHDRVTWRLQGLDPAPAQIARTLDQLASMGLIRKISLPNVRAGTDDVEFVTAFRPLRQDEDLQRAEDDTALEDAQRVRDEVARREAGGR